MNIKYIRKFIGILSLSFVLCGCIVVESTKKVLGISIQTLEEQAQTNGISRSFKISYQDCYRVVMSMSKKEESNLPWIKLPDPNEGDFRVIMSDLYSNPPYVIVIGVQGNIDTTEVGIFFTRVSTDTIRVSISSLSSSAKRKVANLVFARLGEEFQTIE